MSQEFTTQVCITYQGKEVVAETQSLRVVKEQYKIRPSDLNEKNTSNMIITTKNFNLPNINSIYLTVKQSVVYSGIKKWKIYQLLNNNVFDFMKMKRKYFILQTSIDEYLKSSLKKDKKKKRRKT